jgi:hypothetical protein
VKHQANGSAVGDDVSRSKATIRIVDAMGREMPEGDNERTTGVERPLKRGEALANVQKGLADLANELDEDDRWVGDIFPCSRRLTLGVERLSIMTRLTRNL